MKWVAIIIGSVAFRAIEVATLRRLGISDENWSVWTAMCGAYLIGMIVSALEF